MKLDRLLWHQVDLFVEADLDEPLIGGAATWLGMRTRLVPRAGGVTVIAGGGGPLTGVLCRSSGEALRHLDGLVHFREARASEVEGTATAQYHRDCAMRYRALACVIRARATRLWPEEADAC